MAEFNMGYPKKTGDSEMDYTYLYNFVCEMSDRLTYQFSLLKKSGNTQDDSGSGEE